MDLNTLFGWLGINRFPRPRGDGPQMELTGSGVGRVSPPTRGWTDAKARILFTGLGFPAHAGMDLMRESRLSPCARFPRPRGDGPAPDVSGAFPIEVSPPTRGWTPTSSSHGPYGAGFPAHAGMDPERAPVERLEGRFPRPRGDGPRNRGRYGGRSGVSPPTRGWTLRCCEGSHLAAGFPAHAGMDPATGARRPNRRWFPRPRGDGPSSSTHRSACHGVSPPTRGWTVDALPLLRPLLGFPAHAGMDRSGKRSWRWPMWFPRPRGDGPLGRGRSVSASRVSPPTRGWT